MRIVDVNGVKMEAPDLSKGYLINDKLLVAHYDAVEPVEEVGHWEVLKEYPNGGKDIEWVVDIPRVEAKEARDEYEDVLRYIAYTEAQIAEMRIAELKQKLFDTDYNIIKIVEGAATIAEMSEIVAKRAEWRKEINELETLL